MTASCGMQRQFRHRSVQQELRQIESRYSDSLNFEAKSTHLYLHTADQRTIAELQPEGVFEYTPEHGFKGRARRVTIHQVQQQATLNHDSSQLQLRHSTQSFSKDRELLMAKSKTVKKVGQRFGWPIMIGGLLIILFLVIRRAVILGR